MQTPLELEQNEPSAQSDCCVHPLPSGTPPFTAGGGDDVVGGMPTVVMQVDTVSQPSEVGPPHTPLSHARFEGHSLPVAHTIGGKLPPGAPGGIVAQTPAALQPRLLGQSELSVHAIGGMPPFGATQMSALWNSVPITIAWQVVFDGQSLLVVHGIGGWLPPLPPGGIAVQTPPEPQARLVGQAASLLHVIGGWAPGAGPPQMPAVQARFDGHTSFVTHGIGGALPPVPPG